MMKIGDKAFMRIRYGGGYWWGTISSIEDGVATIHGYQTVWKQVGRLKEAMFMASIKKLKEEDLFYKQWAYWEK